MKPRELASTREPSPEPQEAPWELSMPGTASAAASARRARSIRSAGGSSSEEASKSPSSIASGGNVSSGRPAAASSLVTRAIPTASSVSRSSVGQEKSEV